MPIRLYANAFPIGGVAEDPVTGASAAALAGYLRVTRLLQAPACLRIEQGGYIDRPAQIDVEVPASGGIRVGGLAVEVGQDGLG